MSPQKFKETLEKLRRAPAKEKVLRLVLAGYTDVEIASETGTKLGTVRKQISNLYKDFGIEGEFEGDRRRRRDELVARFAKYKPDLVRECSFAITDKVPGAGTAKAEETTRTTDILDEGEGAIANSQTVELQFFCPLEVIISEPETPTDDLSSVYLRSVRGVDYTRLRDLLAAKKWTEADRETAKVMLQVVGRTVKDWISREEIKEFPCTDLNTINQLWVKSSNGHFGFSVQRQLWQSLSTTKDSDYVESARRFGEQVKWRKNNSWIDYNDLDSFTLLASVGHLPVWVFVFPEMDNLWLTYRCLSIFALASRLIDCHL
jgi:hypothetical protein